MKTLVCEQSEIFGPKTPEIVGLKIIEFKETTWRSISCLCGGACQITTAKVYVFSDSAFCMGELRGGDPSAQLGWVKSNGIRRTTASRNWIASMACRRSSSGKYSQHSRRWAIQIYLKSFQCELEHCNGRIIFMSMYNDIVKRIKRKHRRMYPSTGNSSSCFFLFWGV